MSNNKGFTLVEVIIAVAILALISGVLLKTFVVASKVNKNASEIDEANILATSKIEMIKKDGNAYMKPFVDSKQAKIKEEYYNKDNAKVSSKSEAESINVTTEVQEIEYYKSNWEKTKDKNEATYITTTKVKKFEQQGKLTTFIPDDKSVNGSRKISSKIKEYLIVAIENLDGIELKESEGIEPDHNYELYILKKADGVVENLEEAFRKEVNNMYERKYKNRKTRPWVWAKMDAIRGYCRYLYDNYGGHRCVDWNYDKAKKETKALKGSIPLVLDVEKSSEEYKIKIINTTEFNLDIYLCKEDEETNIDFITQEGSLGITNIDLDRKKQNYFDINVNITKIKDKKVLLNYSNKKYFAD